MGLLCALLIEGLVKMPSNIILEHQTDTMFNQNPRHESLCDHQVHLGEVGALSDEVYRDGLCGFTKSSHERFKAIIQSFLQV